jgi:hypothetical protein
LLLSPDFPHVGVPLVVCATPLPLSGIVAGEFVALLATEILPVGLPATVGAKATFSVADCPGVSVVLAVTPLVLYPPPVVVTPEIVTLEFPLLVKVTFSEPLLPTFTFPKLKLVGLAPKRCVAAAPVPLREMASGELGALLTSEIELVVLVAAVGVNTALNVDVFPAAISNGVVKPLRLNPVPATLACEIVTLALPGLDKVKVCELLVPMKTFPKPALAGVTAKPACTPVPLSEMVVGEALALFGTDTLPVTLPVDAGAKVTLNEAL